MAQGGEERKEAGRGGGGRVGADRVLMLWLGLGLPDYRQVINLRRLCGFRGLRRVQHWSRRQNTQQRVSVNSLRLQTDQLTQEVGAVSQVASPPVSRHYSLDCAPQARINSEL